MRQVNDMYITVLYVTIDCDVEERVHPIKDKTKVWETVNEVWEYYRQQRECGHIIDFELNVKV